MINLTEKKLTEHATVLLEEKKNSTSWYNSPLKTIAAIGSGFPSFFLGIPLADSTMTRSILMKNPNLFRETSHYSAGRGEPSQTELKRTDVQRRGVDTGGSLPHESEACMKYTSQPGRAGLMCDKDTQ